MKKNVGMATLVGVGVVNLVLVATVGCGEQSDGQKDGVEEKASALLLGDRPMGLTCGLAYSARYVPVGPPYPPRTIRPTGSPVDGKCMGVSTVDVRWTLLPPAPGFGAGFDGDYGLPAELGFYHQHLLASTTSDADDEDYPQHLLLPKGTACGFKHTCNQTKTLTCMGWDAAVACPAGWVQRLSSDMNAPNGCGFVWCEYQDPNNLCTSNDCMFNAQPSGFVCGLSDSDRADTNANPRLAAGRCLGTIVRNGCPAGFPWEFHKFDDGRPSGHGLAWCTKP